MISFIDASYFLYIIKVYKRITDKLKRKKEKLWDWKEAERLSSREKANTENITFMKRL